MILYPMPVRICLLKYCSCIVRFVSVVGFLLIFALFGSASVIAESNLSNLGEAKTMSAIGTFEITLDPQQDEVAPVGRIVIIKQYSGGMDGTGAGQMISKRTDSGVAVYSAIEEFSGNVDGKSGSFTLHHYGYMDNNSMELKIEIIPGSGTGKLESITGQLVIEQKDGQHNYHLDYQL